MSDLQLSLDNTTLLEAIVWRDDHRAAWDEIAAWAHEDRRRRGYCSMQTFGRTERRAVSAQARRPRSGPASRG